MKYFKIIISLIGLTLAFSCAKTTPSAGEMPLSQSVTLYATMGDASKASVSQSGATAWTVGDVIGVYTSKKSIQTFTCNALSAETGYFVGTLSDGEEPQTVAVYPRESFVSLTGNELKIKYPTSYTYREGYLPCPMVATMDNGDNLAFRHVGGLLSISCQEVPSDATQFMIGGYHCKLSGDFTKELSHGMTIDAGFSEGNTSVTVSFTNDGAAKTFNIPVPCGTYECIYAAFKDASGKKIKEWEVLRDESVERGDMFIRPMPSSMLRVASFNISFSYNETSYTWADERKDNTLAAMPGRYIDLMGSQENTTGQISDILGEMPGFSAIGRSNYGYALSAIGYGSSSYEADAIYLRGSRLRVLDQDTFWYTNTPNTPSRESNAYNMRCCNWAKMELDGDKQFFIFNAHLQVNTEREDPTGMYRKKRLEQAKMIVDKMNEICGDCPVILTGDLNPAPSDAQGEGIGQEATDYFKETGGLREARELVKAPHGPSGSIHYYSSSNPTRRTDFIFVSGNVKVHSFWIDNSFSGEGNWESDHFPVIADISFN